MWDSDEYINEDGLCSRLEILVHQSKTCKGSNDLGVGHTPIQALRTELAHPVLFQWAKSRFSSESRKKSQGFQTDLSCLLNIYLLPISHAYRNLSA